VLVASFLVFIFDFYMYIVFAVWLLFAGGKLSTRRGTGQKGRKSLQARPVHTPTKYGRFFLLIFYFSFFGTNDTKYIYFFCSDII
jgi:hypothetical protein